MPCAKRLGGPATYFGANGRFGVSTLVTSMLITLGATVAELVRVDLPVWRASLSLALTLGAVGLAAARTVPNAVRLGRQTDDVEQQSRLAHMILRDHIVCIVAITAVL